MLNLIKRKDLNTAFDTASKREARDAGQQARKGKLEAAHSALGELTHELVEVGDDRKILQRWFRTLNIENEYISCYRDCSEVTDAVRLTVTEDGQFYKVDDFETADLDKAIQKMMPSILKAFSTDELERIQSKCADDFKYEVAPKRPWYTKLIPTL
jgi:DICT domain-containing protein